MDIDEHKLHLADLYQRYNTDPEKGFSDAEALEILNRDGPNKLSPPKTTSEWKKLCRHMFGGFAPLLWIGVILCFISNGITCVQYHEDKSSNNLWPGILLSVIIIATGFFSYFQEVKIERIKNSFKTMIPQQVFVIRNGKKKKIKSEDLVVGDIIEINHGDRIPADIRILESSNFKVDNSSLTGEAEPQSRSTEFTNENPLETKNLAFLDTTATEGTARGLVIRTGDRSIMGHLTIQSLKTYKGDTLITREIAPFIRIIVGVTSILSISFFVIALILGYSFSEAIIFSVSIIVAIVPKSFLATITICLALTAERLTKRNCLVENLEVVETLGSTSIICVDKTGTLTENRMTVAHMWFDNQIVEADLTENQTNTTYDKSSPGWWALARCAMLCNRADFKRDPENLLRPVLQRECNGDSSESALIKCVELSMGNVNQFREINRKVCEIPFNSTNKYQLSIHEIHTGDESDDDSRPYLLVMKGAPERILERCSTIYIDGTDIELNEYWRAQFNSAYLELGNIGERVLGFCDLRLPNKGYPKGFCFNSDDINFPTTNLRFLGLMSMIDLTRPTAPETIAKCRTAGIKVIMVTGDHPITAKAIARAANIISTDTETVEDIAQRLGISQDQVDPHDSKASIIHGSDFRSMSLAQIDELLSNDKELVFARMSPQQKLMVIERCQQQGAVVTMIGDGVSDIPALQKADVRVVMGISGSAVSKQAADMILLDDNFFSIVTGIEGGRLIFDNIKKSITYMLSSNIPQMAPILMYFLMGIPLQLGVTTILLIDLLTIIPAISLAYEEAEVDIMKKKPRNPISDQLVNKRLMIMTHGPIGLIQAVAGFFIYFLIMAENGFLPSRLFGLRNSWESKSINNLQDSYGQQWTYEQRKQLESTCRCAFFIAIIICQWAVLIVCKTRRNSIRHQGMNNWVLNGILIFEIILIGIISLIPCSCKTLDFSPVKFHWCLLTLPFAFLILAYDEIRKYLIRKNPGGWVEQTTYF